MIHTIDIGNTNKKYSLFVNNEIADYGDYANDLLVPSDSKIIISSVSLTDIQCPHPYIRLKTLIKNDALLDMPILYSHSVGEDRLASAYYIFKMGQERSLVIDSGSFTTLDIVSEMGFEGGIILPGLELLKNSYTHGHLLKAYDLNFERANSLMTKKSIARNTQEAIEDGLILSYLAPILQYIKQNNIDHIFITGGNGGILSNLLCETSPLKIEVIERLIHHGLHLAAKKFYYEKAIA